ncbi:MAG: arylsulfatase [Hyphomonadaceae bacterium]|nr:MAG: arylsulfatase [Hyphomonadaceae bacterium]
MNKKILILSTMILGALPLLTQSALSAPNAKPNVVLLLADDWAFSDVGAFGGEIETPNIDALAMRGVRFSNFHVAASCSPTRAMLQTGVSNHRAGLGNMPETIPPEHQGREGYDAVINNRVVTIAQQLQAGGYRTYLTGKWHLGKTPDKLPTGRGYDHAFALSQSGADNFEDKPNLLLYDYADWTEDGRAAHLPANYYSSSFIIDKMIEYIDRDAQSGRPFLASINFLANHIPVQAHDADIAHYTDKYKDGWDALRHSRRNSIVAKGLVAPNRPMVKIDVAWDSLSAEEKEQRIGAMAAYAGMATAMDREIGRLVAHLKASGEYENTIFVFLSDNGPEATDPMNTNNFTTFNANLNYDQSLERQGRKGSLTAIGASFASALAAPFRGYKFSASEGGIRVPLVISWPGNPQIEPGTIKHGFAYVTDIAPTLLELAGIAPHQGSFDGKSVEPITGHSLVPMLFGQKEVVRASDEALGYELSGNSVLFEGDWKLVKNLPPYGNGNWQLYNLNNDPGETTDLSTAEPQRVTAMLAKYDEFAKAEKVLPMPAGYSAPKQIQANAVKELLIPRLLALWPYILGIIAILIGLGFGVKRLFKRK